MPGKWWIFKNCPKVEEKENLQSLYLCLPRYFLATKRKTGTLSWRNSAENTLTNWSKSVSEVIRLNHFVKLTWSTEMNLWCSCQNCVTSVESEKTSDKPTLRDILIKQQPTTLQNYQDHGRQGKKEGLWKTEEHQGGIRCVIQDWILE